MARGDPQINVRQPPARYAILEAAAFVLGKGSAHSLVKELVDEAVARYAESVPVQKALEARREQGAEDEGKLSHLSAMSGAQGRKRSSGTSES